jgi:hypothetical protein
VFSRQILFCTCCLLCVALKIFKLVTFPFSRSGPSSCTAQSTITGPPSSGETFTSTGWQTLGEGCCRIPEHVCFYLSTPSLQTSLQIVPLKIISSELHSVHRRNSSRWIVSSDLVIRDRSAELLSRLILQFVQLDQDLESGLWTLKYSSVVQLLLARVGCCVCTVC